MEQAVAEQGAGCQNSVFLPGLTQPECSSPACARCSVSFSSGKTDLFIVGLCLSDSTVVGNASFCLLTHSFLLLLLVPHGIQFGVNIVQVCGVQQHQFQSMAAHVKNAPLHPTARNQSCGWVLFLVFLFLN